MVSPLKAVEVLLCRQMSLRGGETIPANGFYAIPSHAEAVIIHPTEGICPPAKPWSAARRYQRTASTWSRRTPSPSLYIEPSRFCADALPRSTIPLDRATVPRQGGSVVLFDSRPVSYTSRRSRIGADRRSAMRCVSSVRTLCRAAPIARRNTESAGARTCSSRGIVPFVVELRVTALPVSST